MHNSMSNNIPLIQSMYLMDLLSMLGICKNGESNSGCLSCTKYLCPENPKMSNETCTYR